MVMPFGRKDSQAEPGAGHTEVPNVRCALSGAAR